MKKLLCSLIILFFAFTLTSCTFFTDSKDVKSPEECVSAYYEQMIKKQYNKAYSYYFSDVSKAIKSEEDFVGENKTKDFEGKNQLLDVICNNTKKIDNENQDVFSVSGILKFSEDDGEKTENFTLYVIKQKNNGLYRILYDGIISRRSYTMSSTHESNLVHADSLILNETVNGTVADLKFKNDTGNAYQFGNDAGYKMQLTVDKKVLACEISGQTILKPGEEVVLNGTFEGKSGTPSNITVTNVYQIGLDGTIINPGNGQIYSVNII